MKCLYYPGCSQKSTSVSYEKSFLAVAPYLGMEMMELEDWNCCGTTAVISMNKLLSCSITARNLALAEPYNMPLITPCPSCHISFQRVNDIFHKDSALAAKINSILGESGLKYQGTTEVYHILEFLIKHAGLEKIKQDIDLPLAGLKIAPYYGCQITRPYSGGDDLFNPQYMDRLIRALGAEAIDFSLKSQCCGGALMITRRRVAMEMCQKIIDDIYNTKADIDFIVTPCGLCQYNLQTANQAYKKWFSKNNHKPVLNITQLIGLAYALGNQDLALYKKLMVPRTIKFNKLISGEINV